MASHPQSPAPHHPRLMDTHPTRPHRPHPDSIAHPGAAAAVTVARADHPSSARRTFLRAVRAKTFDADSHNHIKNQHQQPQQLPGTVTHHPAPSCNTGKKPPAAADSSQRTRFRKKFHLRQRTVDDAELQRVVDTANPTPLDNAPSNLHHLHLHPPPPPSSSTHHPAATSFHLPSTTTPSTLPQHSATANVPLVDSDDTLDARREQLCTQKFSSIPRAQHVPLSTPAAQGTPLHILHATILQATSPSTALVPPSAPPPPPPPQAFRRSAHFAPDHTLRSIPPPPLHPSRGPDNHSMPLVDTFQPPTESYDSSYMNVVVANDIGVASDVTNSPASSNDADHQADPSVAHDVDINLLKAPVPSDSYPSAGFQCHRVHFHLDDISEATSDSSARVHPSLKPTSRLVHPEDIRSESADLPEDDLDRNGQEFNNESAKVIVKTVRSFVTALPKYGAHGDGLPWVGPPPIPGVPTTSRNSSEEGDMCDISDVDLKRKQHQRRKTSTRPDLNVPTNPSHERKSSRSTETFLRRLTESRGKGRGRRSSKVDTAPSSLVALAYASDPVKGAVAPRATAAPDLARGHGGMLSDPASGAESRSISLASSGSDDFDGTRSQP